MNWIQETKQARLQWNQLLDAVVAILKPKKITICYAMYIKVFSDGIVSYLTVFIDDVLNTTNNQTVFPKLRRVFEEDFEIRIQEGSILKYLNFRIFQPRLGFSVDQTDHIV